MGCYAARSADEAAEMPGVVEVVTDKRRLPDLLARRGLLDVPDGIDSFGSRRRAYVKVQDGCRMACSYCIIPSTRPVPVSRPPDEVLDEIGRLTDNGYREIVLTGIHLGHYGVCSDRIHAVFPGTQPRGPDESGHYEQVGRTFTGNLARLVRRIVLLDGEFRVRISSIDAAEVTDELIDVMAEFGDRVCPHLHISMQSGSDAVLRRMNRRVPAGQFVERCKKVCRRLDRPALTTDVMVGFPGETDADFAATCRVVEEVGFSKVHVFRFSRRGGTPAADMPGQVPEEVKRRRAAELSELADKLRKQYFESLLGRRLQVLVESQLDKCPEMLSGTSARYAPVELPGSVELIGRLVTVVAGVVVGGRIRAAIPVPHRRDAGATDT